MLAKSVVVPNLEDEQEWEAFRRGVLADLAPSGELERALAERIAQLQWRLRRVAWFERNEIKRNYSGARAPFWYELQDTDEAGGRELPDLDKLSQISRYEAHLQRSLIQTLREYARIRGKRNGAQVTQPKGVDSEADGQPAGSGR